MKFQKLALKLISAFLVLSLFSTSVFSSAVNSISVLKQNTISEKQINPAHQNSPSGVSETFYGKHIKIQSSKALSFIAPESIFKTAVNTSKTFQIRSALREILKNLPTIGFFSALGVMAFFLVQTLLNPALYPIERITLIGLGASVFQAFFLVRAFIKNKKAVLMKPFIYFLLFSSIITSANSFPQLVEFIPVDEIHSHYETYSDKKVAAADMEIILSKLYNQETDSYVLGFSNKQELADFINHNELFMLTVKNHFQPDGEVINDPHGILRGRFLLLMNEAVETSFPMEILSENGLNEQEKNIFRKSILSFILNHGSILRMNVLEIIRDKQGDSPGISHSDLKSTMNDLKFSQAMFKWADQADANNLTPEQMLSSYSEQLHRQSKQNPEEMQEMQKYWQYLVNKSPLNSPSYNIDSLEKSFTSDEHIIDIGPFNRINPFLIPEYLDSWRYNAEKYTFDNLDKNLTEEGAFWAVRSRLLTMFYSSSLSFGDILNNEEYRHLFPQYAYYRFMTYGNNNIRENIKKKKTAKELIIPAEKLFQLENDIPSEHQSYIFNELFIDQGKVFNADEKNLIINPKIKNSSTKISPMDHSS